MKNNENLKKVQALIAQKEQLDLAKSDDSEAYTALLKEALSLNMEKKEMNAAIAKLLDHSIDFRFLKTTRKQQRNCFTILSSWSLDI